MLDSACRLAAAAANVLRDRPERGVLYRVVGGRYPVSVPAVTAGLCWICSQNSMSLPFQT